MESKIEFRFGEHCSASKGDFRKSKPKLSTMPSGIYRVVDGTLYLVLPSHETMKLIDFESERAKRQPKDFADITPNKEIPDIDLGWIKPAAWALVVFLGIASALLLAQCILGIVRILQ